MDTKRAVALAALVGIYPIPALLVNGKQVRISADGETDAIPDIDDLQTRYSYDAQETTNALSPSVPSFYHTTNDIHERLLALSQNCSAGSLMMQTERGTKEGNADYTVDIDILTVKGNEPAGDKQKVFLLCGEHARELISPESCLNFVESLCDGRASETLKYTEYTIIPNGNPNSRQRVEQGEVCVRTNPQGTDLNRNWDVHFADVHPGFSMNEPDTNPGPHPFSEPETIIFRDTLQKQKYDGFITIHSGTKGMYQPIAYDNTKLDQSQNGRDMFHLLESLDKKYCHCPFGAAGKEVGYSCPGTCLDYAYDHEKVNYAFAFEIYAPKFVEQSLEDRWADKMEQVKQAGENGPVVLAQFASDIFREHTSHFVHMKNNNSQSFIQEKSGDCDFNQFNPVELDEYEETMSTWTNVYIDLAEKIWALKNK